MDTIREWAASICITLVATSIFSMLIPHGGMEKVMKFAISTFFISCLLSPFWSGLPNLSWEAEAAIQSDYSGISSQMNEQVIRLSEANLRRVIGEILEENGIKTEKISPQVHISDDGSISISKVMVELAEDENKNVQSVQELIEQETGLEAEVTWPSGK